MKKLRVLIGCEYTGAVRDAFNRSGCDAVSIDIKESLKPGNHIIGDLRDYLERTDLFDMLIAFPPCTDLASSGAPSFYKKADKQKAALKFIRDIMASPINHIAIENPIGIISTYIRKPDQIVQPYFFGDPYQKSTCLWLKNLPSLFPTNIVDKGEFKTWRCKKTGRLKKQAKWYYDLWSAPVRENRNKTFPGLADAMAQQWGEKSNLLIQTKLF